MAQEWNCYKDKVKMEPVSVTMTYHGMLQPVPGIQCPKCKVQYLLEQEVMTIVKPAETLFEGK